MSPSKNIILDKDATGEEVAQFHQLLSALHMKVSKEEIKGKKLGEDTITAIESLQEQMNLPKAEKIDLRLCDALEQLAKRRPSLKPVWDELCRSLSLEKKEAIAGFVLNQQDEPLSGRQVAIYGLSFDGISIYKNATHLDELINIQKIQSLNEIKSDRYGRFFYPLVDKDGSKISLDFNYYGSCVSNDDRNIIGKSRLIKLEDLQNGVVEENITINSTERGKSMYFNLKTDIDFYLRIQDISNIQDLKDKEQITLLATELGENEEEINIYKKSYQLATDYELSADSDLFFALSKSYTNLSHQTLALKSKSDLIRTIQESIAENVISIEDDKNIDEFIDTLQDHAIDLTLKDKSLELTRYLDLSLSEVSHKKVFINEFKEYKGAYKDFIRKRVPELDYFTDKPEEVKSLQFVNRLMNITQNNIQLVEHLKTEKTIDDTKKLSKLDEDGWKEAIEQSGMSVEFMINNKGDGQPKYLRQVRELAFAEIPTETILSRIGSNPAYVPNDNIKRKMTNFLESSNFNLRTSKILEFDDQIKNVGQNDAEELKKYLRKYQRTCRISPLPEVMDELLKKGMDSAAKIALLPKKTFKQKFDGVLSTEDIELVYEQSTRQKILIELLIKSYRTNYLDISLPFIHNPEIKKQETEKALSGIPNWQEIFGREDIYECDHDHSVFSAAAYLVDILEDLDPGKDQKTGPIAALVDRRPDLLYLEFTKENTVTLMPYIDIANEVMETYIATQNGQDIERQFSYNIDEEITSDELIAQPQFTNPAAYEKLAQAVYPFVLPYHRPLDVIHTFLDHIKLDRASLIESYNPKSKIKVEHVCKASLKLSPIEYSIFTEQDDKWWKNYGFKTEEESLGEICKVPNLLKRAGISYVDLVALLKTNYINPHQVHLHYIEDVFRRLNTGWDSNKLHKVLEQMVTANPPEQFHNQELEEAITKYNEGSPEFPLDLVGLINWLQERENGKTRLDRINSIVILHSPADKLNDLDYTEIYTIAKRCGLYNMTNPISQKTARRFFSKLHRFIRLQKKLKLTANELDEILQALGRKTNGEVEIDKDFLQRLSWFLRIKNLLNISIEELVCLWKPIQTGTNSLYAKLFLNRSFLPINPLFRPVVGNRYLPMLTETNQDRTIISNRSTIMSAFGISADDFDLILSDLFNKIKDKHHYTSISDIPLTLDFVSAIFRYVILSRYLKIGADDLVKLMQIVSYKSFITHDFEEGNNFNPQQTHEFIEQIKNIQSSKFNVSDIIHLYGENLPNSDSEYTVPDVRIAAAMARIRNGLATLEKTSQISSTEPIDVKLKGILSKLSDSEVVNDLLGLFDGSKMYQEVLDELNINNHLSEKLKEKYSYNKANGSFTCKGMVLKSEIDSLGRIHIEFKNGATEIQETQKDFISRNFGHMLKNSGLSINALFDENDEHVNVLDHGTKLSLFFEAIYPYIINQLRYKTVAKQISEYIQLDEDRAAVLLKNDYKSVAKSCTTGGINAKFNTQEDQPGNVIDKINIGFQDGEKWPEGAESVVLEAYLKPPQDDKYTFSMKIGHSRDGFSLFINEEKVLGKQTDHSEIDPNNRELVWEYEISLLANSTYALRIEYTRAENSGMKLSWYSPSMTPNTLTKEFLYPKNEFITVSKKIRELAKAALFAKLFDLEAEEMMYFIDNDNPLGKNAFKSLNIDHWKTVYAHWDFKKKTNVPSLLPIYRTASVKIEDNTGSDITIKLKEEDTMQKLINVLSSATKWKKETIGEIGIIKDWTPSSFVSPLVLLELYHAMELQNKSKVSVSSLNVWSNQTDDFKELNKIAQDIQKAIRLRYDTRSWLEVGKRLNDTIRTNQQQALINYLIVQQKILDFDVKDTEGLFDYFLLDVHMSPCMQTSRMVQATLSVQLFINLCLLNLEKTVKPDEIVAEHWEWKKNYRVWEANRKILLYSENYLESELRDDKSPFFKELESELLQNDITDETVKAALIDYVYKLDSVAHLKVCGLYKEEDKDIYHVVARSYTQPYQYWYRNNKQKEELSEWSAWEHVNVPISGGSEEDPGEAHILPVVWKGQLYIIWPEFRKIYTNQESTYSNKSIKDLSDVNTSKLESDWQWEIQFSYTQRINGKWGAKQIFPSSFITETENYRFGNLIPKRSRSSYSFGQSILYYDSANCLRIKIYNDTDDYWSFYIGEILFSGSKCFIFKHMRIVARSGSYRYNLQHAKNSFSPYLNKKTDYFICWNFIKPWQNLMFCSDSKYTYYTSVNTSIIKYYLFRIQFLWFVRPNNVEGAFYMVIEIDKNNQKVFSSNDFNHNTTIEKIDLEFNFSLILKLYKNYISDESLIEEMTINDFERTAGGTTIKIGENQNSAYFSINYNISENISYEWIRYKIFISFFHAHAENLIDPLVSKDLPEFFRYGLYFQPEVNDHETIFYKEYKPDKYYDYVGLPYPRIGFSFDRDNSYSVYNWEMFFHIPFFIATRLSKNGKYKEAMDWFHYIFNPTTDEAPDKKDPTARFWNVRPFREPQKDTLTELLRKINVKPENGEDRTDEIEKEKQIIKDIIDLWMADPFKPHIIARHFNTSYMKAVVMKYLDNLIAWGDDLFRRFSMESVNEALQLYILASHILGPRPEFIPDRGKVQPQNYKSFLKGEMDALENVVVYIENELPFSTSNLSSSNHSNGRDVPANLLGVSPKLYFGIPHNQKLVDYWDTIKNRLFNIRNGRDITGAERRLSLFEPPIDPGLLARAAAQGLNLSLVLNDLNTPAPFYRFNHLLRQAIEFCSEVKSLGGSILSSLEKRDAEAISIIRAKHESTMLDMLTSVKERQLLEAKTSRDGLLKSRENSIFRFKHYLDLLGLDYSKYKIDDIPVITSDLKESSQLPGDTQIIPVKEDVDTSLVDSSEKGIKLILKEKEDFERSNKAMDQQRRAARMECIASVMHLLPNTATDVKPFGIGIGLNWGGTSLGTALNAIASQFRHESAEETHRSNKASKYASYIRREQDWVFQANMIAREIVQLDKQITAADIRIQIAEKELANHKQQIKNAEEIENFIKDKFTNKELYQWMRDQLVVVHRQSYQVAYDMAKKAEKSYQFELGKQDTNFIQYGYFDSTHEGLTAGDKLHFAIKQMEKAYLEENRREYELSKHVSLALLDPEALLSLKYDGKCNVSLPEELFDLDFPGHYFRRIKSVSLSIPCVIGPYTTINCTLRLNKNSIRFKTTEPESYAMKIDSDDRFRENRIPFSAVAMSNAQNDSGVFDLNFRDERFLPFEGAGVISEWNIELSEDKSLRQFDYNTITDVIMHIKYTAKEEAGIFKKEAIKSLKTKIGAEDGLKTSRLFSLKHDFPVQFQKLKNAPATQSVQVEIQVLKNHFPYMSSQGTMIINDTTIRISKKTEMLENGVTIKRMDESNKSPIQKWILQFENSIDVKEIEDVWINIRYKLVFT